MCHVHQSVHFMYKYMHTEARNLDAWPDQLCLCNSCNRSGAATVLRNGLHSLWLHLDMEEACALSSCPNSAYGRQGLKCSWQGECNAFLNISTSSVYVTLMHLGT
jgi:hypothetical protein